MRPCLPILLGLMWFVLPATASFSQSQGDAAREVRGLVRSTARVEVRTDLVASISKAPFVEGQRFSKGDKLIEFDCSRYSAELGAAKAAAHATNIEARNKRRLYANGAAGKSEVQLAKAEASRAGSDVKARKARMKDCAIRAPFSGRVVTLNARQHEMPTPDKPIIVLIDDTVLELELVVPSNWLRWLKVGQTFEFSVDETGLRHSAELTRLGAEVDPVSQTIKAYGVLKGDLELVLAGMSGTASFTAETN